MNQNFNAAPTQAPDQFSQLMAVLEYRWQILGMGFAGALAALLIVLSIEPVYRATTTIMIESGANRTVDVDEVYDQGTWRDDYFNTQYEIIKSREIASKVVDRLNLVDHSEFADLKVYRPGLLMKLASYLPMNLEEDGLEEGAEVDPESVRRSVISAVQSMIDVEPKWGTRLVYLHVNSTDRVLATQVSNTLAEMYIESGFEAKLEVTQKASAWLTGRLEGIKQKLEAAEAALQEFRDRENLVNVGGSRGLAEGDLTSNMERYREARRKRTELSNVYEKIVQAEGKIERLQEIPILFRADLVRDTKASYLQASEDLVAVKSRYGPKHPKRISAQARFEEAQAAYRLQLQNAADGVKAEYEIAQRTEADMQKLVGANRGEIKRLDEKSYEMQILEREVNTNRELYDLFLTRFRETSATSDYESVNARVIDPAIVPNGHYRPRRKLGVMLGLLSGLFLGFCLAVLRYLLDDTFRSPEAMESLTGMPVLGMLPVEQRLNKRTSGIALVLEDARCGFSEAIRSIRTGILLSDVNSRSNIIAITSAVPSEGKSCLALNLACSLGSVEKTLLIDGDMRRPSIAKRTGVSGTAGLAELIAGTVERSEAISHVEELGIDILAGGRPAANPSELLGSDQFQELMRNLAKTYDRIVIDTAPCQAVSDTLFIARVAKVIISTRTDSTRRGAVRSTLKLLQQADAKILGSVMNFVDHKRMSGDYYYTYNYYGAAENA